MTGRSYEPKCCVLDTGAFALYFGGDERVKPFFDEIFCGGKAGVTCELILGEFWYKTCQVLGKDVADDFNWRIRASNIVVMEEKEILDEAAKLKCTTGANFHLSTVMSWRLREKSEGKLSQLTRRSR